jgi:hypothetical protein
MKSLYQKIESSHIHTFIDKQLYLVTREIYVDGYEILCGLPTKTLGEFHVYPVVVDSLTGIWENIDP